MAPPETRPRSPGPSWIRNLFPGYFALVMATGIVSLAWYLQGVDLIARILFWFNIPAFLLLWIFTLWRLLAFRAELLFDLASHARGATFLTTVAATCVLGQQFVLLSPLLAMGQALWLAALVLWVILIYSFFTTITLIEPKPKIETAINGSWLLVVVATEALCTLGTVVAPLFAHPEVVLFVSLMAYVLGAMFYIVLITLILYRWFFRSMEANMLTPPYWINMGALAITTLAGARLLSAGDAAILKPYMPFVKGFTLFFWSTASWWIPLLILVGIWRHALQRLPLQYDPQYWSLVFPLGMYSVATYAFATVAQLSFLLPVARVFAVAALGAWIITAMGLLRQVTHRSPP